MKKKILAFVTAVTLCAGFASCSASDSGSDSSDKDTNSNITTSSQADSSALESSSEVDESSAPDSSQPDDGSIPDSKPDDSSDTDPVLTAEETITSVLEAIANGDRDACLKFCDIGLEDKISEVCGLNAKLQSLDKFDSSMLAELYLASCVYKVDGKLTNEYLYLVLINSDEGYLVSEISDGEFPADALISLGASEDDIKNKTGTELGYKNAQALLTVCSDMILDAQSFGQTVPDGVYEKNDGTDLTDSINENLDFQGIKAYDYRITVRNSAAVEAVILNEAGEIIEQYVLTE